jgi:hypothetical protein
VNKYQKKMIVRVLTITCICAITIQISQAQNDRRYQIILGDDNITIAEAAALYSSKIRKYREEIEVENIPPCTPGLVNVKCYYPSPFPAFERDDNTYGRDKVFWAPLSDTLNGASKAAEWDKLSREQAIYDCSQSDGGCKKIIQVFSIDTRERMLAQCTVSQVQNSFGPPTGCIPILMSDEKSTWIKVYMIRNSGIGRTLGPRFEVTIYTKPDLNMVSQVAGKMEAMLSSAPFDMITEVRNESYGGGKFILGAASNRISPVLSAARKIIREDVEIYISTTSQIIGDFDTELSPGGNTYGRKAYSSFTHNPRRKPANLISLNIDLRLYVNSQNSDRGIDYVRPCQAEQVKYEQYVRERIKFSLQSLCKNYKWDDGDNLFCDVPIR